MSDCPADGLMALEEALARMVAAAPAPNGRERLPLEEALGRVLAEPLVAGLDLPPFDASAMDGYAINSADFRPGITLEVSRRIAAGDPPEGPLPAATAARVMTGAPLPPGADTVIRQEECEARDGRVRLPQAIAPGRLVRPRGGHIARGEEVVAAGTRLGPAEIGLAASLGVAELVVRPRLRVALFSSGDELAQPGEALAPGRIYDANRPLLAALLARLGCRVIDLGPVADEAGVTAAALERAAAEGDLILSSGGVSVGEEDHIKRQVERLGRLDLWRIRIKPGKPLAFGSVAGTPFIGLPGNPVSSFVTFLLLAHPFILACQGAEGSLPAPLPVRADFDRKRPDGRRNFQRATLIRRDGELWARPYPSQDSATLLSVARSDGLLCIPEETTFEAGRVLDFYPFEAFF